MESREPETTTAILIVLVYSDIAKSFMPDSLHTGHGSICRAVARMFRHDSSEMAEQARLSGNPASTIFRSYIPALLVALDRPGG